MPSKDMSWLDEARCNGADVELFYPQRDKETYKNVANEAKKFCFGSTGKTPCPVRTECLWFAVESDEQHGIWGGLSHRERNAVVRKWQRLYKKQMTLQEYILQLDERENLYGSK